MSDLFGYEPPAIGSTNDLRVHAKQIGECGVALTIYCLRNMGLNAYEVGDTCHYDIMVDVGSSLLRVQVKSTSKSNEAGTFHFNHTKGHRSTQLGVRGSSRSSKCLSIVPKVLSEAIEIILLV